MSQGRQYYVYIMSNWTNTTLYVGVTKDLQYRVKQHKEKQLQGFTDKYNIKKLVYYEEHTTVYGAIQREKQLKGGSRDKKNKLINSINPEMKDFSKDWY